MENRQKWPWKVLEDAHKWSWKSCGKLLSVFFTHHVETVITGDPHCFNGHFPAAHSGANEQTGILPVT